MKGPVILGRWLFRHRSLTPLPLILLILLCFPPRHYGTLQLWVTLLSLFISLMGEWIRVFTVGFAHHGTSGREAYLRADDLNTTGAYSIVRNPLYLGNILMHSGVLLFWGNPLALILMFVFLVIQYYLIILGEEAFLAQRHGMNYADYVSRVPRLFPGFSRYRSPRNGFDWRKILVKENDSLFNLMVMFLIVAALREIHFLKTVVHRDFLLVSGGLWVGLYVAVKIWKRKTAKS